MRVPAKCLVERFYDEVWNRADESVARQILHRDFRFRGSLGAERRGPDGFIEYMRSIHASLAKYTCVIDDLIATEDRAAARMTFKGIHRAHFFRIGPTGREITWAGCAFFTTNGHQIVELWVLGDIDSVKRQLGSSGASFLFRLVIRSGHQSPIRYWGGSLDVNKYPTECAEPWIPGTRPGMTQGGRPQTTSRPSTVSSSGQSGRRSFV